MSVHVSVSDAVFDLRIWRWALVWLEVWAIHVDVWDILS